MSVPLNTLTDAVTIILQARDAELSGNFSSIKDVLEPIWDSATPPDFAEYEPAIRAELIKYAGLYLNHAGWAEGRVGYQLRAKDALTNAVDLFTSLDDAEKTADAQILLAKCYYYLGELEEFRDLLTMVSGRFGAAHPATIRIQLNQISVLHFQGDYDSAAAVLQSVGESIPDCAEERLVIQYHNLAGIVFQHVEQSDRSLAHLNKAVALSKHAQNRTYLGLNLNEIAIWNRRHKHYATAHDYADRAIKVLPDGLTAHAHETHALTYLDEGRLAQALQSIDLALRFLLKTENHDAQMEALLTKCRCLAKLRRFPESMRVYAQLSQIANECGGHVIDKYTQAFCEILSLGKPEITGVRVPRFECEFSYSGRPLFFSVNRRTMRDMNIEASSVVLTSRLYTPVDGLNILVHGENGLETARLVHNDLCTIIQRADGEFVAQDGPEAVGAILGYCPLSEAQGDVVTFKKLP